MRYLLPILFVLAFTMGCGGSDDPEPVPAPPPQAEPQSNAPAEPPVQAIAAEAPQSQDVAGADDDGTELYFTAGEQFRKITRELPADGSPLVAATEALLDGPTKADTTAKIDTETAIPDGVALNDVEVEDGVATVELSPEFLRGVPADPAERNQVQDLAVDARVGQVAYTLTQFAQVDQAKVVSGGVEVGGPAGRDDYSKPEKPPPPITHARGSSEPGITKIQRRLARLRYLPKGGVDGLNGYATQQAVIAFQSWEGLARDGVVGPQTRAALASAHRPRPGKTGPATRIEVYRAKGVALLVENGRTKRAIHVSAGAAATPTPGGSYSVFRKERMSWSYPFQQWLPFASYFNNGIAFHEYASVPTYPASHGCVRVPSPDARKVYRFAKIGTAVIVY